MLSHEVQVLVLLLLGTTQAASFAVKYPVATFAIGTSRYDSSPAPNAAFVIHRFTANGVLRPFRRLRGNHDYSRPSKYFSSTIGNDDKDDHIATSFVRSILDDGDETEFHTDDAWAEQILSVFPASTRVSWSTHKLSNITNKKSKTRTFRMDLAYLGSNTCGWQRQPSDPRTSIQQRVEDALEQMLDHSIDLRAAGRTDAGVHAIRQATRFRSNRTDISSLGIQHCLNQHPLMFLDSTQPGRSLRLIRCRSVQETHKTFHPGFGATARSYVYLNYWNAPSKSDAECLVDGLNRLLRPIVGVPLDYYGLSHGKISKEHYNCTISFASAYLIPIVGTATSPASTMPFAIGIALTSDRFLRRMVRKLVATAFDCCLSASDSRLADDESASLSLLQIVLSRDRRKSSKAAPADGLVFVGAEFG